MSQETGSPGEPQSVSLLLVAEEDLSARRIGEILAPSRAARFAVTRVTHVDAALERLQQGSFDVMLLELSVREGYGLDSLLRARAATHALPVVVLTYQRGEDLALRAVRAGAQDYLVKGEVTPELLSRTLLHAVERHRMMRDLHEAQRRQQFLATHDTLTRLPNRYFFRDTLQGALREAAERSERLAVLFFDLDGFKAVNDNLGHAAGDEILRDVAARLRRVLRKQDFLARLGGDEFVATLRDVKDLQLASAVAEEARLALQKPFYLNEMECWVSSSIGIARYPADAADPDSLVRCADAAMYQAKGAGKNQVRLYEPALEDAIGERFRVVNGIREAIHSGQLMLMFQPQVDIESETLIGAETLVRWRHPIRGIVSPSEFIPIAEDSGLILPIGEWVLRSACAVAAAWKQLPGLRVAVNVSGRQLESRDFLERVERILEETELPRSRLEVEITESSAASDHAVRVLTELRQRGIRTAIDDFGTGYSSLTLLKRLRVDTLKIDRSFVQDAGREKQPVILEGMIRIARGLGIEVVAEGVETMGELAMLRELGCSKMQGYLFSKPIPKQDFEPEVAPAGAAWRIPLEAPESWGIPAPSEADPDLPAALELA